MKMTILLLLGTLILSTGSLAKDELKQIIEKKEQKQSLEKQTRRKKVQMCHKCGKPEPQCECEGEGHGVKHGHSKE